MYNKLKLTNNCQYLYVKKDIIKRQDTGTRRRKNHEKKRSKET